jgi:hypothetical protein
MKQEQPVAILPTETAAARLLEVSRANRVEESSSAFEAREERLQCLALLPRMHAWCAPEDLYAEFEAWQAPLSRFGTDELFQLLYLASEEAADALECHRPFHFSACLSGLMASWSHEALAELEAGGDEDCPRASRLRRIFESSCGLLLSLAQEADATEAEFLYETQAA